jgi:peptidoglycan hydrolase CwlO-like protein
MLELESKLLNEIIRNRDAHNTLTNHSSRLVSLNSTVEENQQNFATLQSQVNTIQKLLESEDEYHHSIEHKLSGMMLDIAEVSKIICLYIIWFISNILLYG